MEETDLSDKSKKLIDSHFHLLEMAEKGVDTDAFLKNFERSFSYGIDIGTTASDFAQRTAKFTYPAGLKKSAGLYPDNVENTDLAADKILLQEIIESGQADALGEAGMDWHWNYGSRKEQIDLFVWQAELAASHGLPLIVHNRLADSEILNVFRDLHYSGPIIIHCYSSEPDFMKKMLDYDCYFSFSGNVTYKKSDTIRQTLKQTPVERLLFETDSPYLSPAPHRGKINTPLNVSHVYCFAAELLAVSEAELAERTEENFKRLFRI